MSGAAGDGIKNVFVVYSCNYVTVVLEQFHGQPSGVVFLGQRVLVVFN
jgi:hypothetical protein